MSPELKLVHFDFDRAELRADARDALKRNAAWLQERAEVQVVVEGRCDERGTTAYNLALGRRRAEQVRSYYKTLGIPVSRVATISCGEERPCCREDSEACRARKRSGVTEMLGRALTGSK